MEREESGPRKVRLGCVKMSRDGSKCVIWADSLDKARIEFLFG